MSKTSKFVLAGLFLLAFLVLIVLVKTVDVAAIGPAGTEIGLSHINQTMKDVFGQHDFWYQLTQLFGIAALGVAALFALEGLLQWIRRGHLNQVDRRIWILAGLYIVTILLYVGFDKFAVNYRPILTDGEAFPEASFPSSHTMLICVVLGSAILILDRYVKPEAVAIAVKIVLGLIIVLTVVGRLASGVHWFSDIVGAVLISAALICLFSALTTRESAGGKHSR